MTPATTAPSSSIDLTPDDDARASRAPRLPPPSGAELGEAGEDARGRGPHRPRGDQRAEGRRVDRNRSTPWMAEAGCGVTSGASRSLASFSICAPARHVLQMLVERIGEDVAAGSVRDEIEVLAAGRIGDRLERRLARIGDRPRRQAVDDVGVVGRRLVELGLGDRVAERSLAEHQAVNDRRIGLEPHVLLQPVDEDAGDARPLVRLARLLLDDRGERHHFAGRLDRQIGRALLPDLVDELGLGFRHARQQRPAACRRARISRCRASASLRAGPP